VNVAAESARGRGSAVTLLPLFRSQTQALVLTRLLLGPGEESLTDLAGAVGAYKNAVKHEVDRLETAGLVSSRHVGRSRLVSVSAEEPVRSILLDLVLHTYGPLHVIGEELSSVAGIMEAFIYGSWAARYAREPGPAPGDIDVLVVGNPDRDDLFEAVGRATARLGKEVNVHVVTAAAWVKPKGAFLAAVRESPLAVVPLGGAPSGEAS
jgi:predicted nucleotidyltransferase